MEKFSAVIIFFYSGDKLLYYKRQGKHIYIQIQGERFAPSPRCTEIKCNCSGIKNNTYLTHEVFIHIVARKIFGVEINLREF